MILISAAITSVAEISFGRTPPPALGSNMSPTFTQARSVTEAISLKSQLGPDAWLLAGGTDLMIQKQRGRKQVNHIIDISTLLGLDSIEVSSSRIQIGALVKMRQIERSTTLVELSPALTQAARVVGGVQVRHVATLGGNIANASPAADTVPVLLALGASVTIEGPSGRRSAGIADLLLGRGKLAIESDEIITHVQFPNAAGGSAFFKAGRRKAMEIAVVNAAACISLDGSGHISAARLALGAVADRSLLIPEVASLLVGQRPSDALFAAAGAAAEAAARPISDVRASADYRSKLARVLSARAIAAACLRSQNSSHSTGATACSLRSN